MEISTTYLTIAAVLGIVFQMLKQVFTVKNWAGEWIPWIVVPFGIVVVYLYNISPTLTDMLIQGFLVGATACGLYDLSKKPITSVASYISSLKK